MTNSFPLPAPDLGATVDERRADPGIWAPAADRSDAIPSLIRAHAGRLADLLPFESYASSRHLHRPAGKVKVYLFFVVITALGAAWLRAGQTAFENPSGTLTLSEALRLALLQNPELAAASAETRAAEGRLLQARLMPNPTVGIEVQSLTGSGVYRGAGLSETTLQLSQLVELGGKRAARQRVAARGQELAGFDYETKRLEVLNEAAQAFIQVLVAQERVSLTEEDLGLAEGLVPAIERRVEAGRASSAEPARARAAAAAVRIELQQAQRDLVLARKRLAASWGADSPHFAAVRGDLDRVAPIASLAALTARLGSNPALSRFVTELDQRRAALALVRADAVPDPTFGLGPRYVAERGDATLVVSFSVPLPLFNRNQGALREAQADLVKTGHLQQAAVTKLGTALAEAYENLVSARGEIQTLQSSVLPADRQAFDAIHEGYQAGRYGYLDLLDARRALTSARAQLLTAQAAYQGAAAQVEALTRGPLFAPLTKPFPVRTK